MRELMEPDKGVDKLEENHVNKLKASILLDVKGIWKEVVSSSNSASYDILEDTLQLSVSPEKPQLGQNLALQNDFVIM